MGLGLYLAGHYGSRGRFARAPSAGVWLAQAAEWAKRNLGDILIEARQGEDDEGRPALFLRLHPGAEEVEFFARGKQCVVVSAQTSAMGPGYHAYLCDVLRRLGAALNVTWERPNDAEGTGDETGYFHTNDREALDQEMLTWVRAVVRNVLEHRDEETRPWQVSMPLAYLFEADGAIATQMGPRDATWLAAVAEDPARGIDMFPWWEDGFGARYYLGRAFCRMWSDVRWRPPIVDAESDTLEDVAGLLERAFHLDPALEYPWVEWSEILGYLDRDTPLVAEVARRAAQASDTGRIGYRRRDVKVLQPGGWWIRIPGSFAEAWENDGNTWCAWEPPRTVWRSTYRLNDENGERPSIDEILDAGGKSIGERLVYRGEGIVGRAVFKPYQEEGHDYWMLQGMSAVPGKLAQLTICFEDLADRQWAIDTWHSIYNPAGEADDA